MGQGSKMGNNNDELIRKLLKAIGKIENLRSEKETLHKATQLKDRQETTRQMTLEELEKQHITEIWDECGGNQSEAAMRLGITRQTLHKKLKKYGMYES